MRPASNGAAAILAHSGGPTGVINASLAGVVEAAKRHREIGALYGARFGLDGILDQEFYDLFAQPASVIEAVARTPSSALGTSRRELVPADFERMFAVFRARDVRYFFYTGGNGSMGTALEMDRFARASGYPLQVIGIPKTIDNDLLVTDHTPGYASTARFFACAVRDVGADNRALPGQVEFLEVLGRNVGWLVAATSLARVRPDDPPHLIYLPEQRLPLEKLLDDIERVYHRLNRCVVAVCEGQLDENGEPFGADVRAGSRGSLAMNLGHRLATLVTQRMKLKARAEKPGLLARVSGLSIRRTDQEEARACGGRAVEAAVEGETGKMVTLERAPGPDYCSTTGLVRLERVAYLERPVPPEWLNAEGNDVLPPFREYAAPLVGAIEPHAELA